MLSSVIRPIVLGPNQPRQFYLGGRAIADLRGVAAGDGGDDFRPEDWVGSATPRYGKSEDGLSRLPDGRYLRDALEADPGTWLGPEHFKYFGASPALLVKLLDAGQRLPVHVHPNRSFAFRHLGSRHGKTESWIVLGATGSEPVVYLGWSSDIEAAELSRWVSEQDTMAMLGRLHKLEVAPGDAVLVPAGTPHAIGEGVFAVELQEPTDFSIMLEYKGFDLDPDGSELGLGRDVALQCVRQKAFSAADIDGLRRHSQAGASAQAPAVQEVMPLAANPYFRAQRVLGRGAVRLEASFAVVVVISGEGSLEGDGWSHPVKRGDTLVVPWGSGPVRVTGEVELLRCLPPLPADAKTDDPSA
jgi:mannose-6-phosphate isomerase